MARNQEKAQSMLNRWQQIKKDMETGHVKTRPWHTSQCHNLPEAERWRKEVIKDVSKKVSEIQNASLGEYRIRELNDEINKLLREKYRWERHIIDLGGPNYIARSRRAAEFEGLEAQGSRGYKYFGAAKDLPGVRELFEKPLQGPQKRTRYEMHRGVTPDYYGYRDDDDGVLEKIEKKAELKIRKKIVAEWKEMQRKKAEGTTDQVDSGGGGGTKSPTGTTPDDEIITAEEAAGYSSLVKVPTQAQMADAVLAMKKKRLLERLGISETPSGGAGAVKPKAETEADNDVVDDD